jgi:hypothetical protein
MKDGRPPEAETEFARAISFSRIIPSLISIWEKRC